VSPDEVERKRMAIFITNRRKDKALFPGPQDPREFWQRARMQSTHGEIYDRLVSAGVSGD